MRITLFIAFALLCCLSPSRASEASTPGQVLPDDSLQISLLTVHPRDKAVYAIFGHTAIRVKDEAGRFDLIYNYGYFDSSKPNFIYYFVKGDTDYVLGIDEFDYFIYKYALDNSQIEEQVLQLSVEEKKNIFRFVNHNALPENREYRYDYFFDNCTTRPRDIIEMFTKGQISYPLQEHPTTLRKLVDGCTAPYPWLQFGINVVIGSGADSTVHLRTEMFLPLKLMYALDGATVTSTDGTTYPLVQKEMSLLQKFDDSSAATKGCLSSPVTVTSLLFILILGVSIAGYRKQRLYRGVDIALFGTIGIAGLIVAFISFISTHPCTAANYNIAWAHPLHLIAAICFSIKSLKRFNNYYHLINFAVLLAFILFWKFIPQEIPLAGILIASCLLLRSGFQLVASGIMTKKKK